MEFRRDKVRGKKEALSSGAESSWPLGLPGRSWGTEMDADAVIPTVTSMPLGSRALFLLTLEGGISLPTPGIDGLAVVASRRSGVVLGKTGASSDRELGRAGVAQTWKLVSQSLACPGPTKLAKRVHLRGDGGFWLCRNSVLSSARSSAPEGPLPSCRHRCSSCFVMGSRTTLGVSSCTGSAAPRRLGSCRDSVYSSEKLLGRMQRGGIRKDAPRRQCPASSAPSPAAARGSLSGESSPNSLTMKNVCLVAAHSSRLKSQCCPMYPGKITPNVSSMEWDNSTKLCHAMRV